MNTSELMKALSDAGAPFEAILIAVRALEEKDAEIAERDAEKAEKRAKDAERKRIERASTDSPRTPDGQSDNSPPSLDKEIPPTPPKEIKPIPRMGSALPRKAGGFPAPEGVDPETWIAFCQQRKKPVTKIAYTAMLNKMKEAADAGWPPGPLFERAIESGYETIFVPSENRNGQYRPANDRPNQPLSPMVAAGIKREADFANRRPDAF